MTAGDRDPLFPNGDRPPCGRCNKEPVYLAGLCGSCYAVGFPTPEPVAESRRLEGVRAVRRREIARIRQAAAMLEELSTGELVDVTRGAWAQLREALAAIDEGRV